MKKFFVIICFGVLSFGQNLLPNPGFENWSGGMPVFWYKDDSILIYQENVIVHSGSYSVKDSLITTTQDRADFISDTFAITPNTQYTFSIWVYDNDPVGRLRQAIAWHVSGAWQNVFSNTYSGNSTNWQQLTFTALSPDGADSAFVFVRAYDSTEWDGGAVFYLDDASFTPPATQPPVIVRFWHKPTNPPANVITNVYAKVGDDGTIIADTLFYGINNLNTPTKVTHSAVSNDTFRFQIPGQPAGDTIFYYLKFTDDDNLTTYSDTNSYYVGALNIFINEVYYDAPGTDTGCYIEIYGPGGTDLNGITLVGVNGADGNTYATIDLSGYSIPQDGFFVIAQDNSVPNGDLINPDANLQNGPDNLELRFNNITIDALGYGILDGWTFTGEWLPADDVPAGHCLGRYPDGDDTDNNSVDFVDYTTLTPGEPNPEPGIAENKIIAIQKIAVKNPIVSGVKINKIVKEKKLYPVSVFNITGQLLKTVSNSEEHLNLPAGVYFLKLNPPYFAAIKIVIVK
uniref:T9SS type A sorting domain-containing protein n=1 Tax=candidate division WOR-3 bacterium TaxID=2052148 RepID=A0A7C4TDT5_UNCW3